MRNVKMCRISKYADVGNVQVWKLNSPGTIACITTAFGNGGIYTFATFSYFHTYNILHYFYQNLEAII
jgi:hypothetical protein